jgi:uracil-DNA glycosylase family 4
MIVGEAPGFTEDETGEPFVGQAGQILNQQLQQVGISRLECYVTNVVKCRPPANRTPVKNEIMACLPHLLREIDEIKPQYILLLGNTALQGLLGKSGITKYRGQTFEFQGITVMPTLHPALILRNPKYLPLFISDLNRFSQLINGQTLGFKEYKIKIIRNWKTLRKVKRKLEKKRKLAYDFELQGLNWKYAKVWMLGIATSSKRAYIIPLQHPQSPFKYEYEKVLEFIKDIFEDRSKFLIAQNGKFDNKVFRRFGIQPFQNWDTMLCSHLLDENTPNDLEYLSMTLLGCDDYKKRYAIKFDPPSPLRRMALYCGEDCCNTFGIQEKQEVELVDDSRLENIFFNLKMPASRMLEKMEMTGIWVDAEKLHRNGKKVLRNLLELEKKLNEYIPDDYPFRTKVYKSDNGFKKAIRSGRYGDKPSWFKKDKEYHIKLPFNWGSPQQLGQLLYLPKKSGGWGLTPPDIREAKTKTGGDATGEPVLVHLRESHEAIPLLIEYKKWRQLYNNFIVSWKEKIDPETSRLYPTAKLHGTVTHRLSMENPNPQQTPRDVIIRGNLGVPPGKLLVEVDYSQIELRIAAFESG